MDTNEIKGKVWCLQNYDFDKSTSREKEEKAVSVHPRSGQTGRG